MPLATIRNSSLRKRPPLRFLPFGPSRRASLASLSATAAFETSLWNFLSSRTVLGTALPFWRRAKATRADSIATRRLSRSSSSVITRWTYGAAAAAVAFAPVFFAAMRLPQFDRLLAVGDPIPAQAAWLAPKQPRAPRRSSRRSGNRGPDAGARGSRRRRVR